MPRPPTVLRSCTNITKPGLYWLGQSLAAPSGQPCMQVHSQGPVTLDCRSYALSTAWPGQQPLLIQKSSNFTIQNCYMGGTGSYGGPLVEIDSSSNGTLSGNQFLRSPVASENDPVAVISSSSITVTNNTFYVPYAQTYTSSSNVHDNSFSCASTSCSGMILANLGSGNTFANNKIDGKTSTDQMSTSTGADDGIILGDEIGDNVYGNTISNVFDCGIGLTGNVGFSIFNNNTITNASNCGIGGWFWMSFYGNIVHGNTVTGAGNLFTFFRYFGLRPANFDNNGHAADTGVYFTNNTFDGNSSSNPYSSTYPPAQQLSVYLPFEQPGPVYLGFDASKVTPPQTVPTPSQFHLTGNSFSNNNFGSLHAYFGEPTYPGAVVDKGNNVCAKQGYPDYPLACGRP